MNDLQRARVQQAANVEAVRRMLIKYFSERGYNESFDRSINPVLIQDLPHTNPGLNTKIEIEPHALEIDPTTSKATIGWNLFVLGNQRIFLGETQHANLAELARQIKSGTITPEAVIGTRRCTTPRRIINFIEHVLNNSAAGHIDISQQNNQATKPRSIKPMSMAGSQEGQWYTRSGYGT